MAGPSDRLRRNALIGGEAREQVLVAEHVIEHAGEEAGVGRGLAQGRRSDAGERQKPGQRLRVARKVVERVDCEDFRGFAGPIPLLFRGAVCVSETNGAYLSKPDSESQRSC